ncbi:unnamed protein product [Euphydryas editha]|uniref:Uncharacterized protein n=1 Tax=Euphydryas editha TaxID=104508 RepID=A0AAU9URS7_EUPED|nr:unnamed protein product [Euphydryas editha]
MSFNIEEMYTTLRGVSGGNGAKFDTVRKWFHICKIIDGRYVTEGLFIHSYERLCPNREEMSLVQFVQLLGILARETKQEVDVFVTRFRTVNQQIIDEIRGDD